MNLPRTAPKSGELRTFARPSTRLGRPWRWLLIVVVLCAGLAGGCGRALLGAFYLSHGSALLAGQANEPVALNAAAEALARARALLPDNSLVLRRSAELYRRQGRDDAAVAALEQALALQPSSQLLQRELMLAYLRVKDSERSAVLLEKLTGAGGGVELVGDGYLRAGQAARALEIYTLSLAANDAPPEPLLVRTGLLSAALGDAAEARRLLEASGAPTPVDALVEAVSRTPDGEVHVGDSLRGYHSVWSTHRCCCFVAPIGTLPSRRWAAGLPRRRS
jgi:tetratricopeptide (TPR) repeat protein